MEPLRIDNCYNMDCNVGMRLMQEQGLIADWCITDPPYGINAVGFLQRNAGKKYGKSKTAKRTYEMKSWDTETVRGGDDRFVAAGEQRANHLRRQLLHGRFAPDKELGCLGQTVQRNAA